MDTSQEVIHHQTVHCSARGSVRRSANWDWVTCEECWRKQESNRKGSVIVALIFAGLFFLLCISCLAMGI